MLFRRNTSVAIPEGVDWSQRATPSRVADEAEGMGNSGYFRKEKQARRENLAWMQRRLAEHNGVVVGYHGTTTENARQIAANGFEDRFNQEGRYGVSAWDSVVALESLRFATRRSREVNAPDAGTVIETRLHNPRLDVVYGRLEWLGQAADTEVVRTYTPDEMLQMLGEVSTDAVRYSDNTDSRAA